MGSIIGVSAQAPALAQAPPGPHGPKWWQGWSMDDPRLSQPIYEGVVNEELEITASDGAMLKARVLRPVTPEGVQVPTIMQLSPYLGHAIQPDLILPELQKHDYVERGYALIGVSLRGSGGSEGCVDYQGLRDQADVDQILDTIAAQPWSNGLVGAIGLSWDGTSLNAAALSGNPHLATIVPHAAITDWYKWSYIHGIPGWYVGYLFNLYAPPVVWFVTGGVGTGAGVPTPEEVAGRACEGAIPPILAQVQSALTGVRNEWWDERDLVRYADQIDPDLAVLQVQGSLDIGVRPDMLHTWDARLRELLPNYRLIFGSWGHLWPDTPDIPAFDNPDVEFNRYPLNSWSVLLLRWFDHWLKDANTGITKMPGALIQDQYGEWHEEDALQASRSVPTDLYPTADGELSDSPGEGSLSFVDNGLGVDPRGACVYVGVGWILGCAPAQPQTAQFFQTAPYETETRFTGVGKVQLRLSHSAPHGRVGVSLYDINGDKWKWLTYGYSSLNLRDGNEYEFVPITPGEVFTHEVELIARDFVLPPGHRLGIAIGSQVDMNPRGLGGNGYMPVPSGGVTEIDLAGTVIQLNRLPGSTPVIDIE